ncbi:hypothetical protein Hypma_004530 [Hypsizygus marmoreus]|uniref:F-box domain-containing protein n=1 Tax=Hypsizygus marmoreus TaxID=39966 RepID=A0A369K3N2_HYPMA|nr:hypothetical protein Hypma_004530 [Hypsizygus marmoreus]
MVDDLPFNDVEPSEWHEISSSRSVLDPKTLSSCSYDWTGGHPQKSIVNNIATHLMKQERRSRIWEKKVQDVSRLHRQPLEIIFEVFTHLHPLDLHHLARTTKAIRSLIMTRASSWLWELVFEQNAEVPPCPPELSFPRWTNLLFGPTICEKCTTHEDTLNMTMRQRVCTSCEPWVRIFTDDDFAAALSRWGSNGASGPGKAFDN